MPCLQYIHQVNSAARAGFLHIPKIIAPAARKRVTTPASAGTIDPRRLKDPAVVFKPGNKKKIRLLAEKTVWLCPPSDAIVAILSC